MSSTILKIIPSIPDYVPSEFQQERVKLFLSEIYSSHYTEFKVTDSVEFVDQGENFESVSCNLCGQDISTEEWQDQMDKAYKNNFQDLNFQTSCQHRTSLNDLNYKWPAGFAKFMIGISDAQREPGENILGQLRDILGAEIRIIWAHY